MKLLHRIKTGGSSRRKVGTRGIVLIETVVAISIIGTAILATLAATSGASISTGRTSMKATASWVATSQVEYIQDSAFILTPGIYPSVPAPTGYTVENVTSDISGGGPNIQLVTVTVSNGGVQLVEVETVKVDRW